jgi:hypothetical protein
MRTNIVGDRDRLYNLERLFAFLETNFGPSRSRSAGDSSARRPPVLRSSTSSSSSSSAADALRTFLVSGAQAALSPPDYLSLTWLSPQDIVDGHRQRTVSLVWRLFTFFQPWITAAPAGSAAAPSLPSPDTDLALSVALRCTPIESSAVHREISVFTHDFVAMRRIVQRKLQFSPALVTSPSQQVPPPDQSGSDTALATEPIAASLLSWCRVVCADHHITVNSLHPTSSTDNLLASGRLFCALVFSYCPDALPFFPLLDPAAASLPFPSSKYRTSFFQLLVSAVQRLRGFPDICLHIYPLLRFFFSLFCLPSSSRCSSFPLSLSLSRFLSCNLFCRLRDCPFTLFPRRPAGALDTGLPLPSTNLP